MKQQTQTQSLKSLPGGHLVAKLLAYKEWLMFSTHKTQTQSSLMPLLLVVLV
jgi:hypothetical protein